MMNDNLASNGKDNKAFVEATSKIAGLTDNLDPFADVANLRIAPSFVETAGVKKLRTTVPVRKPGTQDFVRVHGSPEYRNSFAVVELKDEREDYLVLPNVVPSLPGEVVYKTLYTAVNRQGVVFLWPVRLPSVDDKANAWWQSAREAAELAVTKWVRMKANMSLGAYEITVAESEMTDPDWTGLECFADLLRIAFRGRLISDLEHPVIKRLRGLA
jgi:hypothetical protein